MNETKNTPRLQKILGILGTKDQATRAELSSLLASVYPVSKPTLVRDLKHLISTGQIQGRGAGRNTSYFIPSTHPLLKPINLAGYFELDPDQRPNVQKQFNPVIFTQLPGLFTTEEFTELEHIYKPFPKKPNYRELERFVIELSWKSSKIEGNTYTLLETEGLIKDARQARGNSLTSGLNISTGIRQVQVGISGTAYLPPDNQWQITEYFKRVLDCVNQIRFPLEKALVISAIISYLQPFADGNKRTSRMLSNAVLIAHDYYPLSYRNIDENEYKQALILFFETNNLYHIKRLLIDQYR